MADLIALDSSKCLPAGGDPTPAALLGRGHSPQPGNVLDRDHREGSDHLQGEDQDPEVQLQENGENNHCLISTARQLV